MWIKTLSCVSIDGFGFQYHLLLLFLCLSEKIEYQHLEKWSIHFFISSEVLWSRNKYLRVFSSIYIKVRFSYYFTWRVTCWVIWENISPIRSIWDFTGHTLQHPNTENIKTRIVIRAYESVVKLSLRSA